jgi:asparagine synthase (glutamine-hydrolysing)
MCGICGIISDFPNSYSLVQQMCNLILHRGPDNAGIFQYKNTTLGHRRLSIIDLVTGDQPIFNEDKSIAVVFNGEIYNFQTFKDDLINKGHKFYTTSDTEILVHCYEEYGLSFIEKLNGIFAFALYDLKKNKLVLVRDHYGIKPLHYWFKDGQLVFASEQKAILLYPRVRREINYNALHSQINLRYTQGDETLFKNIYRLPPAHYLIYENNHIEIKSYYQLSTSQNNNYKQEEVIDGLRQHLKTAIQRQLLSDVPIGVYLSGGMDSSTIVALMHELNVAEINTFTLGFNEGTDEFPDADRIARHFETNHHTTSLEFEPLAQLPEVIWHAEEPKINLLQGFNMSRFVSPSYKVILGGLGGDELFIGYDIYKFIKAVRPLLDNIPGKFQKYLLEPLSKIIFSLQNSTHHLPSDEYRRGLQMLLSVGNLEKFYLILRNCWDYDSGFYKQIYHPDFPVRDIVSIEKYFTPIAEKVRHQSAVDAVAYTEFHSKMVNDYLLVDDRMSMAHSIELRVPFLDKDLVEYVFSVPAALKMKGNTTKSLFRQAMKSYLPEDIINKKKWGFTVNPYEQFKKDLKQVAEKILTEKYINEQGIFNYTYIKRILDHPANTNMRWHYNDLWIVLGIAIWEKMFIFTDNFIKKKFALEDYYND